MTLGALAVAAMTLTIGFGLSLISPSFGGGYADVQQRYAVLGRYPWALAATGLVALSLVLAALRAARLRARPWSLWAGALSLVFLLTLVAQAAAPTAAFAVAWPLAAALVGAAGALALGGDLDRPGPLAVVAVCAALGLAGVFADAGAIFSGVGVDTPAALAAVVPMATVLALPLAAGQGRRADAWAPAGAFALGFAALAMAAWPRPGTRDRPALTQAFYLAEPAQGRFWRASALRRLDGWSMTALTADGGAVGRRTDPPLISTAVYMAQARATALTPPRIEAQRTGSGVSLRIIPNQGGREIRMRLRASAPVADVLIEGRPVRLLADANHWASLSFEAPPASGVALAFRPAPGSRLDVVAVEVKDGWPTGARIPARPVTLQPWSWSDTTQVVARAAFAW